jgi:hypothetical protein
MGVHNETPGIKRVHERDTDRCRDGVLDSRKHTSSFGYPGLFPEVSDVLLNVPQQLSGVE